MLQYHWSPLSGKVFSHIHIAYFRVSLHYQYNRMMMMDVCEFLILLTNPYWNSTQVWFHQQILHNFNQFLELLLQRIWQSGIKIWNNTKIQSNLQPIRFIINPLGIFYFRKKNQHNFSKRRKFFIHEKYAESFYRTDVK